MKTIQLDITEKELADYSIENGRISFKELVDRIKRNLAIKYLRETQEIAEQTGLREMTLEEINSEIKAYRLEKESNS